MPSEKMGQGYSNEDQHTNSNLYNLPHAYNESFIEQFSTGEFYRTRAEEDYVPYAVYNPVQNMHDNHPEGFLPFDSLELYPGRDDFSNDAHGLLPIPYLGQPPELDDHYQVHPVQYSSQGLDGNLLQNQPLYGSEGLFSYGLHQSKVEADEDDKQLRQNGLDHSENHNSSPALQNFGSGGHVCVSTMYRGGSQGSGFDEHYQDSAELSLDGNEDSTLLYSSFGEAMKARGKRRREEFKKAVRLLLPGHDIPLETKQQRPYVKRLVDAIGDTSNVIDKKTGRAAKDAQAVQRINGTFYSPQIREQLSWDLVNALVSASVGVTLVDPLHRRSGHLGDREKHDSFMKRFEKIEELCRSSKAACKHFFDPEYIHRVVDAPDRELKQVKSNGKLNGVRNVQNELGRKLMNGETVEALVSARVQSVADSQAQVNKRHQPKKTVDAKEDGDNEEKKAATQRQILAKTVGPKTPKSRKSKGEQSSSETEKRSKSSKRKLDSQFPGSDKTNEEDTPSKKRKPTPTNGVAQGTRLRTIVSLDDPPPQLATTVTTTGPLFIGSDLAISGPQVPALDISNTAASLSTSRHELDATGLHRKPSHVPTDRTYITSLGEGTDFTLDDRLPAPLTTHFKDTEFE